jgi:S1-C subfamily serine protease
MRQLFEQYAPCMVAIITEGDNDETAVGAGFHIGDRWIATARHVVESRRIVGLAPHRYATCTRVERILFPSDPKEDVALMLTDFSLEHYMSPMVSFSPPRKKYDQFLSAVTLVIGSVTSYC